MGSEGYHDYKNAWDSCLEEDEASDKCATDLHDKSVRNSVPFTRGHQEQNSVFPIFRGFERSSEVGPRIN